MQFAGLRLNGFKSFVDATDLAILPGLTGIVGPNGCGKSNLLEALRWVMGESRPTAMRGAGMEDVIFNGSRSRGARHFAEVTLFIDNESRRAPAGLNDSGRIEILRRITRDLGSTYRANGREVRARDVQILFADAASGSLSPALVRQGQVAELVEARPAARRRILEDAAGIAGLHARRHEAELKLRAAEVNLARIGDTLEQMAAQMAALARQARQAVRYRELAAQLRRAEALLALCRWRAAEDSRLMAERALRESLLACGRAEATLRACAARREAVEAGLPALREEDAIAAAVVQRLTLERERLRDEAGRAEARINALVRRKAQIETDSRRETELNRDAGAMIERLTDESAAIARAGDGHAGRLAAAARDMEGARSTLAEREAALGRETEAVAQLAAMHQSVARQLADCVGLLDRATAAAARGQAAIAAAADVAGKAAEVLGTMRARRDEALALCEGAEGEAVRQATALAALQEDEAAARGALGVAAGEASALEAESAALARLIARDAASDARLLDRISVDHGWERALGAALGDDLLRDEARGDSGSGWVTLASYDPPQPLPAGLACLSDHVRAPALLARRLSQTGLVAASDGPSIQPRLLPGQRIVSREGDLWRWDGFCRRAEEGDVSAAVHLQHVNRAARLAQDLAAARAREVGARETHDALRQRLSELARNEAQAREARRAAERALALSERDLSRSEAEAALTAARLEAARQAAQEQAEEVAMAQARLAEARVEAAALAPVDRARALLDEVREQAGAARAVLLSARAAHDALQREGEARERRLRDIATELAGWRDRLAAASVHSADLAARLEATGRELAVARDAPARLEEQLAGVARSLLEAESRKSRAADALARAEAAEREARLAEREAAAAAASAGEGRAQAEARLEAAREAVARALGPVAALVPGDPEAAPAALAETLGADMTDAAEGQALEDEIARLARQRDALGAVNLRAEEDAREIRNEHDTLAHEQADLEAASAKLRAAIAGLNREGRARLLAAFEEVNRHFATLFTRLFGGGEARLELVDSDDPLQAGLEILCQPPGKRLSQLSLLSGGEQTLTALALIFGVFLSNPAPICVLDEVDAALDDANVARLCDMLDEIAAQTGTRFLVITHHALTMARMDRLFGVTMQEQGVSQLVSVDLGEAEAMVA